MRPEKIKQARKSLGLTQAAMAAVMGIGTRKWERWEGGHSPISPEGARLVEVLIQLNYWEVSEFLRKEELGI